VLAVVAFNSFGGLLWPRDGLEPLALPVLLVGGTLDLITPPTSEQLPPFVQATHPRSRLVLVKGASHFSPVRISGQGEALFRLGDELVGIEPQRVQNLLLNLTSEFLQSLRQPSLLSPQQRQQEGITAWVLDRRSARSWWRSLPRRELQP
jgi:predicted dienelactone hydrolase